MKGINVGAIWKMRVYLSNLCPVAAIRHLDLTPDYIRIWPFDSKSGDLLPQMPIQEACWLTLMLSWPGSVEHSTRGTGCETGKCFANLTSVVTQNSRSDRHPINITRLVLESRIHTKTNSGKRNRWFWQPRVSIKEQKKLKPFNLMNLIKGCSSKKSSPIKNETLIFLYEKKRLCLLPEVLIYIRCSVSMWLND